MGLQPSASRTALLFACPRPFDPDLEVDPDLPGEPARYGSAFHELVAACLRSAKGKPLERAFSYAKAVDKTALKYDVRAACQELAGHVKGSVKVLRNWLEREKLEVRGIEAAYAVRPGSTGDYTFRAIPAHDEDHRYEIAPGEVPGTADLIATTRDRSRTVVVDHKTGGGDNDTFAQPAKIPQMKTLGLIDNGSEVAIFHADRRGLPMLYSEPYGRSERRLHSAELYEALARIGHGFLRPGPQCGRCPAKLTCPAHAAELLSESTATLVQSANALAVEPIRGLLAPDTGATLEVRVASLYELLKKFRALEKAGSDEIKRLVKDGAVVEMRDGRTLTIQRQTYETLSKKSVLEAFGAVAGAKELERLRKKGAIRETTRELIVPEK